MLVFFTSKVLVYSFILLFSCFTQRMSTIVLYIVIIIIYFLTCISLHNTGKVEKTAGKSKKLQRNEESGRIHTDLNS